MNQKTIIITNVKDLEKSIGLLSDDKILGIDTETEGLDPLTCDLRLLQIAGQEHTLVIDAKLIGYDITAKYVGSLLEDKEIVKIFHNAKFDCKFIKHHLKIDVERIFDSYLASILTEAGIRREKGYHGLEKTLLRYTGLTISKSEQSSDWSGELSESQYRYAATDANVLHPLREAIIQKLKTLGLIRCAKLEFDAVPAVAWLELSGFYLDFNQWGKVAEDNLEKSHELAKEICHELKDVIPQGNLFDEATINLNSPIQVLKYFKEYGVPMEDSTREPLIQHLVYEYPIVGKLLEYKGCAKSASSFGQAWAQYINPATGRIHADFKQIGAEDTGRFSCTNPNLQQIPKENEFRNCFKPQEGYTLISGDYSQIELRILADISRDKVAIGEFAAGKDFHTATAEQINRPRSLAKNCNFAIPYGAGPNRVATTANVSIIEAEMLMEAYFKAFPNFKKWINAQKRNVLRTRYARTVAGRLARFIFDENDNRLRSQAQRNAVNMPIQGSSADILKRALYLLHQRTKGQHDVIKLVNIVHDEINLEVRNDLVEYASKLLNDAMVEAAKDFLHEVEVKVDLKVAKYWSKD